ncbi:MAG: hypothetical protein V4689_15410 [Verrucomicrobiota bacterium]
MQPTNNYVKFILGTVVTLAAHQCAKLRRNVVFEVALRYVFGARVREKNIDLPDVWRHFVKLILIDTREFKLGR